MRLCIVFTLLVCSLKTDMFLSFSFPMASWYRIHTPFRRGTSLLSTLTPKSTTTTPKVTTVTTITNRRRPKVLFVLGGPGAGKGTQCAMLSSEYGMQHLSAGELLREEIASGSSTGKMIATIINEGKIVPVQISLDLIRAKIESIPCNRFLVDGFPRNWDNVQGWDNCMTQVCDVEAVMFIDCPEAELEKRLLSRGQTSGRSDDNAATARKRFATFKEATMPVVEHFESQQKLIRVPGHLSVANVFLEMKLAIVPFIEQEIIHLTGVLLDAIAEKDWQTYITLVDPSLTCFEKEAQGGLVEGLEFHKFYFDQAATVSSSSSSSDSNRPNASAQLIASKPTVRTMGKSAVINFTRTLPSGEQFEETRVWQLFSGEWRMVHFHRGPAANANDS